MLSWLYDIQLVSTGLRFVLFQCFTLHVLKFSNIERVTELRGMAAGPLNAYNFKNRLFIRVFLIETRTGWFTRRILVTPPDAELFTSKLAENGVEFR